MKHNYSLFSKRLDDLLEIDPKTFVLDVFKTFLRACYESVIHQMQILPFIVRKDLCHLHIEKFL